MAVLERIAAPTQSGEQNAESGGHEGRMQTGRARHVGAARGKVPADTPALKPYWGKPAVRNFRGTMETSASYEARSAPSSYPTAEGTTLAPPGFLVPNFAELLQDFGRTSFIPD